MIAVIEATPAQNLGLGERRVEDEDSLLPSVVSAPIPGPTSQPAHVLQKTREWPISCCERVLGEADYEPDRKADRFQRQPEEEVEHAVFLVDPKAQL
jgi:hypothetical protein